MAKMKRAWLVTWEGTDPRDFPGREIISIQDPRVPPEAIKKFVHNIYISSMESLEDQMYFSTRKNKHPYLPESDYGKITCGHNPCIDARIVENLTSSNNGETIEWDEIVYHRWHPDNPTGPRGIAQRTRCRFQEGGHVTPIKPTEYTDQGEK